jgi:DNA-binding NarL/FixJ family response regulator
MTTSEQNQTDSIKVIICDDHALFRSGVKIALSHKKDIEIIAEAENGQQLLNTLHAIQPDVILLDITMPILGGIETLPEVKKMYPDVKVIMLTMHNDHSMIAKLMEMGANSYLTKDSDSDTIHEAIVTCRKNEYYFNSLTNLALIDGLKTKRSNDSTLNIDAQLSEKETHILKLMCEEKSTKEIADMVDLSPRTVEAIRDKLRAKTGAKSMAGLVLFAVKNGIVTEG